MTAFGLVVAIVACATPTPPETPNELGPPGGAYGVLFIGNSLTYFNDMPSMVQALLSGSDLEPVAVRSIALPNYGLQDHWVTPETRNTMSAGWDVVIMQQGPSATEGRPSLLEYSQRFADEIRAGGGEPGLYMVWPSRARDFDFDGVSDSYSTAADSVNGWLFPAGEAWRAAWRQDSTLALYGPDAFHPSVMGSYLAALVIYEQLSGEDLAALPLTTPVDLGLFSAPDSVVRLLHDAAEEANNEFARAR